VSKTGRKIFHELEKLDLEVGWIDKDTVGMLDLKDDTIKVNVATALATIVIHEVLHSIYPNKDEDWILIQEEKHRQRMNRRELEYLASYVLSQMAK